MTADVLRVAAGVLAIVGLWAATAMLAKVRGIVERPEARLFFGIPNALFGVVYYALVIAAAAAGAQTLLAAAAVLSGVALATSVYLAVVLIRQHLDCPRCWTAHAVNVLLCPLLLAAAR